MNKNEYDRLLELKKLIDSKEASREEKKEYMSILYENGNISKKQLDEFNKGENTDSIINAALVIGGVLLATWLLTKIFEE